MIQPLSLPDFYYLVLDYAPGYWNIIAVTSYFSHAEAAAICEASVFSPIWLLSFDPFGHFCRGWKYTRKGTDDIRVITDLRDRYYNCELHDPRLEISPLESAV